MKNRIGHLNIPRCGLGSMSPMKPRPAVDRIRQVPGHKRNFVQPS